MANTNINTADSIEAIKKLIAEFKSLQGQTKNTSKSFTDLQNALASLNSVSSKADSSFKSLQKQLTNSQKSQKNYVTQTRNLKKETALLKAENEKLEASLKNTQLQAKKTGGAFSTLWSAAKALLGAFGLLKGAQLFKKILLDSFALIKTLDSISFAMSAIVKNTNNLVNSQKFLLRITQDFGIDLLSTSQRYLKFLAAAQQTGLSLKQTESIFESTSKAAAVLGLKTDELTGVYLALEQMLSKGKVTTEELRRQLGERLPGAMGIMAKAIGVTISELDSMMKKGEVLSSDALPKFAKELERAYGIESVKKIQTLQSAQTRLTNIWVAFVDKVRKSTGINEFLIDTFNLISSVITKITNLNSEFESSAESRIRVINQESNSFGSLISKIIETNENQEDRNILIDELIEKYPFMLTYMEKEKLSNQNLRIALNDVNNLYIKRLALTKLEKDLNKDKAIEEQVKSTALLAKTTENLRLKVFQIIKLSRGAFGINADLIDEKDILKTSVNLEKKLEGIRETATMGQDRELLRWSNKYLTELRGFQDQLRGADAGKSLKDSFVKDIEEKIKDYEKALGITKDSLEDFFNMEDAFVLKFKLEDETKDNKNKKTDTSDLDSRIAQLKTLIARVDVLRNSAESNATDSLEYTASILVYETQIIDLEYKKRVRIIEDASKEEFKTKKMTADEMIIAEEKKIQDIIKVTEEGEKKKQKIYEDYFDSEQEQLVNNYKKTLLLEINAINASNKSQKQKQQEIKDLKVSAYNDMINDQIKYLKDQVALWELEGNIKKAIYEEIAELETKLKANAAESSLDVTNESLIKQLDLLKEFSQSIFGLIDAFSERKIEAINAEINAEEKKYDKLIDLAKNEESEKAALEKQKNDRIAILEKKRLKEQQKQAKIQKSFAIAEIAINTAIAVSKVWGQTGIFGVAAQVPVIAMGFLQTAAVMAAPIPQYAKGLDNAKEDHIAMINDGGSKEYIERDGKILSTDTKNAIVGLKKGDTVYKDYDDMIKKSILFSAINNGQSVNNINYDNLSNVIEKSISKGFGKAKVNSKVNIINKNPNNYLLKKSRFNA